MATKTAEKAETTEAKAPGKLAGLLKKVVIGVVVLALLGGAAWWFVLRPKPEKAPEPGEIVTLDPIQINLSQGHYLRIGLALQLTASAHEVDGSKALDAAIAMFSGRDIQMLQQAVRREELKEKLGERLDHDYHGDVMEVYFTEFVTQ